MQSEQAVVRREREKVNAAGTFFHPFSRLHKSDREHMQSFLLFFTPCGDIKGRVQRRDERVKKGCYKVGRGKRKWSIQGKREREK